MTFCSNCGFQLQNDALFCPECGAKNLDVPVQSNRIDSKQIVASVPVAPIETEALSSPQNASQPNQFQNFLKISLPDLIKKVLFDPLDGTKKVLAGIKEPSKIGIYCILICSFVISLLVYLRIPSEERRYIDFFEYFFRAFSLPVLGSLIITFFSFIIKAINNSQKANFGNELLTGGIVCLGYALFFTLAFVLSFILEDSLFGSRSVYGYKVNTGPSVFAVILIICTLIYLFVITSNSFSQSLRSSGVKDSIAFYLSPFIIVITAYFTIRLWIALFGAKYGISSEDIMDVF